MKTCLRSGRIAGVVLLALLAFIGCEGGPSAPFTSMRSASGPSSDELEMQHREQYQTDREHESLYWLLANRVRQGMSPNEVGEILGEDGEREYRDRALKAGDPTYRREDVAYRWGPDRSGQTIILLFREGKLLNFDPREFESGVN